MTFRIQISYTFCTIDYVKKKKTLENSYLYIYIEKKKKKKKKKIETKNEIAF